MSKPKFYALLVGINRYKHIGDLSACEKDIDKVQNYLERYWSQDFEVIPKKIKSENATKTAIVAHLQNYFNKAKKGDVALFYFSGHGAQEKANPVFHTAESDKLIEVLACYDSEISGTKNFLSDKELRYLISKISKTGAEVVTIFDCCNSGDNTRSLKESTVKEEDKPRFTGSKPLEERAWEEFIFSKEEHGGLKASDFEGKVLADVLPEGEHFQIGACEPHQFSFENTSLGSGYFTAALLKVLKATTEPISYYGLIRKLRVALQHRLWTKLPQHPTIYVHSKDKEAVFKTIFGGKEKDRNLSGEIAYFKSEAQLKSRWQINLGGIHGVVAGEKDDAQIIVRDNRGRAITAYVHKVYTNHSEIRFNYLDIKGIEDVIAFKPSRLGIYTGFIGGLMSANLNIYITGKEDGVNFLKQAYNENTDYKTKDKINIVEEENQAHFTLFVRKDDKVNVTAPFDHGRSWIYARNARRIEAAHKTWKALRRVSKWQFVKTLKNEISPIRPIDPIKVDFIQDGVASSPNEKGIYYLKLNDYEEGEQPAGKMKIKFTNRSRGTLYLGVLYLSTQMAIDYRVLKQQATQLKPKEEVFAFGNAAIPIKWEKYLTTFDWEEDVIRFKLIISTVPFDTQQFEQEAFKPPILGTFAGIDLSGNPPEVKWQKENTWTTQICEVRIKKPNS